MRNFNSCYYGLSCCGISNIVKDFLGTIPLLRQQRDWVGGVRKMAIFADVQYCICADKVGRWGLKRPKICWLVI